MRTTYTSKHEWSNRLNIYVTHVSSPATLVNLSVRVQRRRFTVIPDDLMTFFGNLSFLQWRTQNNSRTKKERTKKSHKPPQDDTDGAQPLALPPLNLHLPCHSTIGVTCRHNPQGSPGWWQCDLVIFTMSSGKLHMWTTSTQWWRIWWLWQWILSVAVDLEVYTQTCGRPRGRSGGKVMRATRARLRLCHAIGSLLLVHEACMCSLRSLIQLCHGHW
jgi:hypothetical protein